MNENASLKTLIDSRQLSASSKWPTRHALVNGWLKKTCFELSNSVWNDLITAYRYKKHFLHSIEQRFSWKKYWIRVRFNPDLIATLVSCSNMLNVQIVSIASKSTEGKTNYLQIDLFTQELWRANIGLNSIRCFKSTRINLMKVCFLWSSFNNIYISILSTFSLIDSLSNWSFIWFNFDLIYMSIDNDDFKYSCAIDWKLIRLSLNHLEKCASKQTETDEIPRN